ncbi:MAG: hypothetical protein LH479_10560 [Polaromonas sp.]|nr:hypothetical protein [Polaromonas sp.]
MPHTKTRLLTSLISLSGLLQGCTVLAIADAVGTVAVKSVELAADAAIGVVKISGKAIGAAADAVTPANTD